MSTAKMEIDITADASNAQAGLKATAAAAERASDAVKDLNAAAAQPTSAGISQAQAGLNATAAAADRAAAAVRDLNAAAAQPTAAGSSQAQAGLNATAAAADRAAAAVRDLNAAADSQVAAMFREQAKAVEQQAAAFRQAAAEAKNLQQLERDRAKLADLRASNSVGTQLAGMGRTALAALPAAAAAGAGALVGDASMRGAAWEEQQARLRVSAGADFGKVNSSVESLSTQYGQDATGLAKQADRLMRSGMDSESAVKAIESAVIAARGDVEQMEGLLDALAEASTRGYLEEDLLGKMDEQGIALRTALQEHLNMSKEELDTALSAGKIDVESYFAVIDKLTGKGTAAQKAAEDATKTTGGLFKTIASEWDSLLRNFGQLINEGLVAPLARFVLPALQKAAGFFRELMRDKTEDYISEVPSSFKEWAQKHGYDETPKERTREEIEAEAALRAEAQKNTEAYKQLRQSALAAINAEQWSNLSATEQRKIIGQATGLGEGVTVAGIDAKLRQEAGWRKLAAGDTVTAEDLAETQRLMKMRERLKLVEREENLMSKQAVAQEKFMAEVERERALMRARLEGDTEHVRLLEQAAETERLAAQYRTQGGLSQEEALKQAAETIELREQARDAQRQRPAESGDSSSLVRATGWISSALADVGGGGSRIRSYEASAVKVAQNTEKNTSNIAVSAGKILEFLNNNSLAATPVLP